MKRFFRPWLYMVLIVSLLAGLLPMNTASAASRISITSLYVTTAASDIANGRPANDNLVPRVTTSTINLLATVESITDSQLPNLFLEITNVTTNQTVVERGITAQKTGTYDIQFNNVPLTEGLNRVVVKLDGGSTVESAPGWVYYTGTTNITDLRINGEAYSETRFYPSNPSQSTVLNISGRAPNAAEVRANLYGSPSPITGFFSQGEFYFIGDDINKGSTTANLQLRPGDNPLTFYSINSTRTFQLDRNLIYDNGKPFAFQATINDGSGRQKLVSNPVVEDPSVTVESLLKVDLDTAGNPQYRYVEITAGGARFGPYDLGGATAATRVTDVFPKTVYQGHSNIDITLAGTALDNVKLFLENNTGTIAGEELAEGTTSADGSLKTFLLDASVADQRLLATGSPYKLTAKSGGVGGTVLSEFEVNVVTPSNVTLPTVTALTMQPAIEGDANTPEHTITFQTPFDADTASPSFNVQIMNMLGTSVAGTATGITGYAAGSNEVTFHLPDFLAQGGYKVRVNYAGYPITEKYFQVGPPAAAAPTITNVVGDTVSYLAGSPSKTYLFVQGTNFGTDRSVVTGVLNNGAETINLSLYDLTNTMAILELANQTDVDDASLYDLVLTVDGVPVTAGDAVTGRALTLGTDTDGKVITAVSPLQYTTAQLTDMANTVQVTGVDLDNGDGLLSVQILNEDGTGVDTATVTGLTDTTATLQLPALTAGGYILEFTNTSYTVPVVLAQYPFAVADPQPTALSPNVRSVSEPDSSAADALTLSGTGFGRDTSLLRIRFTDSSGALLDESTANSIVGGTAALFDAPIGLSEGTYTVTVLYNNEPIGEELQYTVSSPPATLSENSQWSKDGQYRVYNFLANLELTSARIQTLDVHFYNVAPNEVPPTSFSFQYENPNLPYIDRVEISNAGTSYRISEATVNELNEQPVTFIVFTNSNANSVNYYIGDYSSSLAPKAAVSAGSADGLKKFAVTVDDLPNGPTNITFVPSVNPPASPASKAGENLSARQTYSFNVSSTPYVILTNLHNGMVIKDITDLRCTSPTNTMLTSCIQGRLVNVPAADYDIVDVYINGTLFTMSNTAALDDFLDNSDRFWFRFGPGTSRPIPAAQGGNLLEGKNTIRFVINREVNGAKVPITEASFEIFKFSTNAPEFLSIRPVETGDLIKFRPANVADSFVTNETSVEFSGQFANATEIRLTVRTVDPVTGNTVNIYDRRYGSGYNLFEPATNNPNYFRRINQPSNGQFATRAIPLAATGDTIFEFSITNSTNITVTRTITMTREPLPYVIVSPKMTEFSQGVLQANINSNYVEFEIKAENADAVLFNKEPAVEREVTDLNTGERVTHFFYEVRNLRNGRNNIKFTVVRGQENIDAQVNVFNVNTSVEGAQYKTPIANRIRAFNNMVELSFPRGTNLLRNDPAAINQFITTDRQILIGIANSQDGRVDKYKHPAPYDGQIGNPNPLIPSNARLLLAEPTGRFRAVSPLIWIDAGTIPKNEQDVRKALAGSGRLPYDEEVFYSRNLDDLVVPSQPGTLTLKYDPIIRNEGWKYITVYHYDIYEDYRGVVGPRWRNIGGVIDTRNNTITVPMQRFGYYQVMYLDQSYDDVIAHPWARDQLDILYARGIMLNKNNTNFVPNDPISRGEFATLLVKIFNIPLQYTENPSFTDVLRVNPLANGLYDYKYIETASRAGIIRGAGGGRFQPDAAISRQDAAVMIARAANLRLGTDDNRVLAQLQRSFTDANNIDIYARASVQAVEGKGFIQGKENVLLSGQNRATFRFDPTATFTRAEAAAVAIRVMQDQKIIPN